ncbi:pantetheine-phosphate adenylyltransferase [Alloprevotella sp. OH1205_COT-284]|uniref:pantetheine-phosphate adenylyltransferase n=1 Tax=Alloprevotella sp. OH1205_COT-284 TaxID=2491043 RepID=UPI000F5D8E42|nr:pantetheine-phosphate adenylyltransferase [Alloprevotella sp. OH1205_COT-284]RRD75276.1 pantetheine-phosphate adenylyltransferase [Alloprevotella sp. OH1205_COT-284]
MDTSSSHSPKTAIFPGSFDPFTIGHASVVRRALTLFDKIVIGVGYNIRKRSLFSPEERVAAIRQLYRDNDRIHVVAYDDLTADLARRENAKFVIRGIRSIKDFEYERDTAGINHRLADIETVLLFTEPQYADISSTVVRELISFGKDVSEFLPTPQAENPER